MGWRATEAQAAIYIGGKGGEAEIGQKAERALIELKAEAGWLLAYRFQCGWLDRAWWTVEI